VNKTVRIGIVVCIVLLGRIGLSSADLAECIPLSSFAVNDESYYPHPGDLVSVGADGFVQKSMMAESPKVMGVVSTKPAHVLRGMIPDSVEVALTGVVPCHVVAENGPVLPGDLLISSSRPGYAMRANKPYEIGTIVGKAIERLDSGEGTIFILVALQ